MDLSSAVALVKGDEGTTVHLTVIRQGEPDYLEIDVVRRKLENETVTQKMLENNPKIRDFYQYIQTVNDSRKGDH